MVMSANEWDSLEAEGERGGRMADLRAMWHLNEPNDLRATTYTFRQRMSRGLFGRY